MLNYLDALVGEVLLCGVYCGSRGVLTYIVQQTDLLCIGVVCENEVHDGCGVKVIAGAGDICARLFEAFNELCAYGIGNCGEHNGNAVILGERLHTHGDRSCNAYHEINAVSDEVGDYLLHNGRIGIAVVIGDLKGHALLVADLLQAGLDVFDYLVKGRIVNIVAYADLVDLCAVLSAAVSAGAESEYHCQCAYERECLFDDVFHCFFLQKFFVSWVQMEGSPF